MCKYLADHHVHIFYPLFDLGLTYNREVVSELKTRQPSHSSRLGDGEQQQQYKVTGKEREMYFLFIRNNNHDIARTKRKTYVGICIGGEIELMCVYFNG